MAQLRFRLATPEDTPEIVTLLNATFRAPIDAATWDWYVYGNPIAASRVYVVLEPGADRIAGFIGYAPIQLKMAAGTVAADYAHHLVLKPDYRDTLSYVALMRHTLAAQAKGNTKLTIGPPNKTAYSIHKKLMKWVDFGYLDCVRKLSPGARQHSCRELTAFPESFGRFYGRISEGLNLCVEKNVEWMNWRFCRRPGSPYTVYMTGTPDEMTGYVVLKRWQDPSGYRKAHMIDFHAVDEAALAQILEASECYANGCDELNYWAMEGDPYRRPLEAVGFAAGHRQPFVARSYDGSPIPYPGGACSLSYGDGDTLY